MFASVVIFAICYILIASEKVDRTIVAVLGAAAGILFHLISYKEALEKIDLNVVFLLIGMMIIVGILAQTGIFEWIAITIAQQARGNGLLIMSGFMLVTAVLSAFLDNVTTVILIAPITILITQLLELPTVPFLIMEAVFSNVGGTATLVGDPPNILIGSATGLDFNAFLLNLAPPVLVVFAAFVVILAIMFRRSVTVTSDSHDRLSKAEPALAIIEPVMLRRALPVFGLVVAGFFLGRPLGVEPGIIALGGAFLMLAVTGVSPHKVMENVEWNTILFFVGLFMLIGTLEVNGVFAGLGRGVLDLTHGNLLLTTLVICWVSAVMSAIVDNIPLVMAMIPLIKSIIPAFVSQMGLAGAPAAVHARIEEPLFWALALGACLGGNGTLIGASANVVIAQVAVRNNYELSFWQFTRYGFPFMVLSLLISSLYLYLRYFVF
ncbi:MAG: ArsB/NhaD family transporter [Kiritimatiellaeota bacterium]|nr:ArsB/NhaD family transporter [Kiritimatiellota bacterium]